MHTMQRQNRPYMGDMVWKGPEILLLNQYMEIIRLLQGVSFRKSMIMNFPFLILSKQGYCFPAWV